MRSQTAVDANLVLGGKWSQRGGFLFPNGMGWAPIGLQFEECGDGRWPRRSTADSPKPPIGKPPGPKPSDPDSTQSIRFVDADTIQGVTENSIPRTDTLSAPDFVKCTASSAGLRDPANPYHSFEIPSCAQAWRRNSSATQPCETILFGPGLDTIIKDQTPAIIPKRG